MTYLRTPLLRAPSAAPVAALLFFDRSAFVDNAAPLQIEVSTGC
jgi:hypothetical protein